MSVSLAASRMVCMAAEDSVAASYLTVSVTMNKHMVSHFVLASNGATDTHDIYRVRKSADEEVLQKLQRAQKLVEFLIVAAAKIQHSGSVQRGVGSRW